MVISVCRDCNCPYCNQKNFITIAYTEKLVPLGLNVMCFKCKKIFRAKGEDIDLNRINILTEKMEVQDGYQQCELEKGNIGERYSKYPK